MKINVHQLLIDIEWANKQKFNAAMSHLNAIVLSHTTGVATSQDPNLKAAFAGTLDKAKRFLESNPLWSKPEVEIT